MSAASPQPPGLVPALGSAEAGTPPVGRTLRFSQEPVVLLTIGGLCGVIALALFFSHTELGASRLRVWSLFAMDAVIACAGGGISLFVPEDPSAPWQGLVPGEYVTVPAAEWRGISEELVRARKATPKALPPPSSSVAAEGASGLTGAPLADYREDDLPSGTASPAPAPVSAAPHPAVAPGSRSVPPSAYDESAIADSAPVPASSAPKSRTSTPSRVSRATYDEGDVTVAPPSVSPIEDEPLPEEVQELLSEWYGKDATTAPGIGGARPAGGRPRVRCVTCDNSVPPPPNGYVCRECGEPLCDACWDKARAEDHPEVCSICRILGRNRSTASGKGSGPAPVSSPRGPRDK
jgi:hypothetical protein